MKKALSVLLAAIAILGLAIPMASAESEVAKAPPQVQGSLIPPSATIYTDPSMGPTFVDVKLPAAPHAGTCPGPVTLGEDNLFYWDTEAILEKTLVTYLPERNWPTPQTPVNINNTLTNAEMMRLQAYAAGTMTVYAQCIYCNWAWEIDLTIIEPDPPPEDPPKGLLQILRAWWFDLKWTWDFQIHPFFKYIYFNFCGWIASAWRMMVNAITNLFNGLVSKIK